MDEKINSKMIILGRESRGYTQKQLSEKIGVAQSLLSKIEAGIIAINDELLEILSQELNFPKTFFFEKAEIYPLGINFFRKAKGTTQKLLMELNALVNIDRIRIQKLLRSVEVAKVDVPFMPLDGIDFKSPRAVAKSLRIYWRIPEGPIDNMTRLLEDAGIIVIPCNFNSRFFSGLSTQTESGNSLIFINSNSPGDRQRFTLAHELGHFVMHQIPTEDGEKEADIFASEFLIPTDSVKDSLYNLTLSKLATLKRYWKVSMAALMKKAVDLNTLTPNQQKYLYQRLGKLRLQEPLELEIPKEKYNLIKDIFQMHINELNYTEAELKSMLYLDDIDFSRFTEKPRQLRLISNPAFKGG